MLGSAMKSVLLLGSGSTGRHVRFMFESLLCGSGCTAQPVKFEIKVMILVLNGQKAYRPTCEFRN
jgi:hypothetical protein